uniref:DNA/RNA non-specific endonuclease n=1 Tax=Streptomyces sp. NBC_00008 TaxID=2903610 RepID=A0AAU2VPG8_9ACTN
MSAADKAKEIIQDITGMWWPDADEGGLRDAAKAWRDFADDLEDVTVAANKSARGIIDHNKGEAISAFGDPYWRRYYHNHHGWLQDMTDGARDTAKALDQYADIVHHAVKQLEHELEIVGATIVAGTALAIFTAGISEVAAAAATASVVELAATLGVTVSTEIAAIAGTTLATAAIGGIESITVDLAVTQPAAMITGESDGLSLDEVHNAAMYGSLTGGLLGGGAATYRAVGDAGGMTELLGGMRIPGLGPNFALPGSGTSLDGLGILMRTGRGGRGETQQPPSYALPLDSSGRSQGVRTQITESMLDKGDGTTRRMKPPGWGGADAGHTRGHLLARSLGGDGKAAENIAIMYDHANNVVMNDLEKEIYSVVAAGHAVDYAATPVYRTPTDLVPSGIHITAKGGGLDIDQTVINK